MISETLAPDVAWEPSGHLSEVALSALSDGEDGLLDDAMLTHAGACDACCARLGEVALRSADIGAALAGRPAAAPVVSLPEAAPVVGSPAEAGSSPQPAVIGAADRPAAPVRRRVPVGVVVAGLLAAVIGAAPAMMMLPAEVKEGARVLAKVLPSLLRMLPAALGRLWSGPTWISAALLWAVSVALVLAGLAIAKRASSKTAVNGGSR